MKNADMPAMPLPLGTETTEGCQGLTKREMMAMHILPALIQKFEIDEVATQGNLVARAAVVYADLLISELDITAK